MCPHWSRIINLGETTEPCSFTKILSIQFFFFNQPLFRPWAIFIYILLVVYQTWMAVEWVIQLRGVGKLEVWVSNHALRSVYIQIFIEYSWHHSITTSPPTLRRCLGSVRRRLWVFRWGFSSSPRGCCRRSGTLVAWCHRYPCQRFWVRQ